MTVRHVVNVHNLKDFVSHTGTELDMSYRVNGESKGLKLGYVDKLILDDVTMVTSSIDEPNRLVTIPGRTEIYFLPTHLRPFRPSYPESARSFFKPGASGSPLIYNNHIVGLVPFQNLNDPYEIAAIVFNGGAMKENMEHFGLILEQID